MTWADDRREQTTPAPREHSCLDCGKSHAPRAFLHLVSPELKVLYRAGKYRFAVPPVPTALWDEDAWCRWIDGHGGWLR